MKQLRFFGLSLVLGLGLILSKAVYAEGLVLERSLNVCFEDAGWPPYSFVRSEPGEVFRGFNADMLQRIFGVQGIDYQVVMKPWKRCLQDAMGGDVDIVMDAASNSDRQRDYLLTNPVYSLTPVFFFRKEQASIFTEPKPADLFSMSFVCGQKGYTYNNFGFDNGHVAMISKDLEKIVDLTIMGRCDIGLSRREIMQFKLAGDERLDKIAYQTLVDIKPEPFYWMINRSHPQAAAIKQHIDREVARLYASGEAKALLQTYFE